MKKMTILVSLLVLLAFGGISTYAADTGPAFIHKDFGCALYDGNGKVTIFTTDSHTVVSNDANGNTILKCFATLTEEETPEKAVVLKGFPCGTQSGSTTNTKAVVTPGGRSMLTCIIHPNQTP
ncbi:MAG: hypothetical protein KAJ88_01900 [Candidatus Aenigmarchaeota archaeon]|nr:hypothetical protein [Candidatus Aenigmarchaeota archaeon]